MPLRSRRIIASLTITRTYSDFGARGDRDRVQSYRPRGSIRSGNFVPADNDIYIDLNIKHYVLGKLISTSRKDVENTDHTYMSNYFLHLLFRQCNVTLNYVIITQASENYNYRSYLEIRFTYNNDATVSDLSNPIWYLDRSDM